MERRRRIVRRARAPAQRDQHRQSDPGQGRMDTGLQHEEPKRQAAEQVGPERGDFQAVERDRADEDPAGGSQGDR